VVVRPSIGMGLPGGQISASLVVFHLVFRSIFYTDSIERMSSSDESGAELSRPSSVTPPDSEKYIERVLGRRGYREFLIIKHTAIVKIIPRALPSGTLTPERNALGVKVLEACECLRW
jgi:hypothetical protein